MKKLFTFMLVCVGVTHSYALSINEIMSNPVGDDGGREWIELYNESDASVDLATLTISIKGGNPVVTTSLQGGTLLPSHGYAIVGSTISTVTKFLQDYPAYSGLLFKSSISLVNTGVTSIDVKVQGQTVDTVASYTAAKEGFTLSKINGNFVAVSPSPGEENKITTQDTGGGGGQSATTAASTTATVPFLDNQAVIAQMSPPSADIILYVPLEKVVVAGADSEYVVSAATRAGKSIDNLSCLWAFGDGGQSVGTSTVYRYVYAGMYNARVECGNGSVIGIGKLQVRVVPPDIAITEISTGKYGPYVDIVNPNSYDIDFSQWKFSVDGAIFSFPKNTVVGQGLTTRFSGLAMGFGSTTISSSTIAKILFPNMEEVAKYTASFQETPQKSTTNTSSSTISTLTVSSSSARVTSKVKSHTSVVRTSLVDTSNKIEATSTVTAKASKTKDTRLAVFFKTLFGVK
jgi:hypothetical protein